MTLETTGIAVTVRWKGVTDLGKLQEASGSIEAGYTAEAPDENGAVYEEKRGDFRATVPLTIIAKQSADLPPHNAIVAISGFNNADMNGVYRLESTGETQAQQAHAQRTYSAIRYLDNGVPSDTTTTTTTTTTT